MSVSFYTGDCIEGPSLTNSNFDEILSLINYGDEIEEIKENGLRDYELREFENRIDNLIALIQVIPSEFHTETIFDGNVIYLGKEPDYYLRRLKEIKSFIFNCDFIYFA